MMFFVQSVPPESPPRRRNLRKLFRWSMYLGVLGTLWFGLHTTAIFWDGLSEPKLFADVAVVLGNKVNANGRPAKKLKSRLDRAISLYKKGRFKWVIVSGGLGIEGHQEAAVMGHYLRQHGIPARVIVEDPQGRNTHATAWSVREFMKQKQLSSVIAISNAYHISRCKLALRRFGVRKVYGAHAHYPDWSAPWSILREFVAYYVYMWKDYRAEVYSSTLPMSS